MNFLSRPWLICVLFGLLVLFTRIPHAPGQLFTFDDVNLAYSVGHFDIRISQPQPPGYPLFVLQMRALYWLRFRRVESILLTLALAGSIAALGLLAYLARQMFQGLTGFFAAALLALHPVFWHSGITSALRVQLAVVSLLVAAACWRAWTGDPAWVLRSAIVLGLCAGVRPEIGVVLFPLWAVSAWRAPVSWKQRAWALAAMAAAVLLWLLPAMFASGGPADFIKACLGYVSDQASETSALFGAEAGKSQTTFWRLIVWTCCGLIAWTLPAVLAWKRKSGWQLDRNRFTFLALWLLPQFAFAILVHVQDPGHALAMAPPIALFGGYLFNRALHNVGQRISRWQTVTLVLASLWLGWLIEFRSTPTVVAWLPLIALLTGLLLKLDPVPNAGSLPRLAAMAFLLVPVFILNSDMFNFEGWYYKGASTAGIAAASEQVLSQLNSGLALTSLGHIKSTLAVDDHAIRAAIRLAGERPGVTTVIWEQGPVAWRKVAYYVPRLPVVVLEHAMLRAGSQPVIVIWNGPVMRGRIEGPPPVTTTLPRGGRIVWLLNPRSEFFASVSRAFSLTASGPAWYTDLPTGPGARTLGPYQLQW